jgi:hypothetical protein
VIVEPAGIELGSNSISPRRESPPSVVPAKKKSPAPLLNPGTSSNIVLSPLAARSTV